jgi:hypothetical protein
MGSGMEQLADFFGIVERVPDAKYILAHAVGTQTEPPVVDGYLDAIEERYGKIPDNFWFEIRDFSSPGVRSALRRISADRIIAGTDWTTQREVSLNQIVMSCVWLMMANKACQRLVTTG